MTSADRNVADRLAADAAVRDAGTEVTSSPTVRCTGATGYRASALANTRLDLRDLKSHLADRQARRACR